MKTITALVTRGFDQQFDYNVLEALKPFGADRHARLKRLEARLTSKNDYEFSFAVEGFAGEGDGSHDSHWEMLLASVPSTRRDFAGSPLRTYLWLSGDSADASFAADVLTAALVEVNPRLHLGESGPLSKALDGILTSDIVDGLAKQGKESSKDPVTWGDETLVPDLRKALESMSKSKRNEVPAHVLDEAEKLFKGDVGRLSGEYSPFLDDPMKDDPNMTYHFPNGEVVRFNSKGEEAKVPPKRMEASRPFVQPPPPPIKWGRIGKIVVSVLGLTRPIKWWRIGIILVLVLGLILLIIGLRSCR